MSDRHQPDDIRGLAEVLDREREVTNRLCGASRRERDAMAARDFMRLEGTVAEKQDLIDQLQRLETERQRLLAQAGHSPTPEGIAEWAATCGTEEEDAVLRAWTGLVESARDCQMENLRCRHLNTLSQRWVREMLHLYRGDSGDNTNTYHMDGSVAPGGSSKPLARA